ncbi:MalY/PatB family protein [Pontivivens insulae]|uniref:cysteine-S-conjugate beta-lyase n=1 Tax=Pontivivens insulae TaxID=1639689 RepID=A0A2R8ACE7_9RHOB|nr:MalY/PatB family protein [Pontivivens insulae]RED13847.1 cystathionine beta-lyase [Pontivivens insulae]SPF29921.1 Cystathionine beta-lyase PatB [Pontivivens insulae]
MPVNFDEVIDRRNTHSVKWDACEALYGVSPDDGIAMWVADMDFKPPTAVQTAMREAVEHGVFGYFGNDKPYKDSITGWMSRRHGWDVDPATISTTHGLVSGVGLCLQAFTEKGDGVALFTPVYHAFAKMIHANERRLVECEMDVVDGRFQMNLERLEGMLDGLRMVILCSPHNPGGTVWTAEELTALADFCEAHNLILISDEIHHDLVFGGAKHHVLATLRPQMKTLITLTAASKTFNLAGGMTGNVTIADVEMRAKFQKIHLASGASPNRFGMLMTTAAYSEGDAWLEACIAYLDENRRIFEDGVAAIPGVNPMRLNSTYLEWVDFNGTGMDEAEIQRRVQAEAKIAPNHGPTFGKGGDNWLRFNIATRRALVVEAVDRLQNAFADLQ